MLFNIVFCLAALGRFGKNSLPCLSDNNVPATEKIKLNRGLPVTRKAIWNNETKRLADDQSRLVCHATVLTTSKLNTFQSI
jgi:hypothetical protein